MQSIYAAELLAKAKILTMGGRLLSNALLFLYLRTSGFWGWVLWNRSRAYPSLFGVCFGFGKVWLFFIDRQQYCLIAILIQLPKIILQVCYRTHFTVWQISLDNPITQHNFQSELWIWKCSTCQLNSNQNTVL